jgi:hypothetical protein
MYLITGEQIMADKNDIENLLKQKESWTSLYELAHQKASDAVESTAEDSDTLQTLSPDNLALASNLNAKARALASDVIAIPESLFKERLQRLNFSVRELEDGKNELLHKNLIELFWVGKGLLLVPATRLYIIMGLKSPYKRNVSDVHSFLVLVAEKLINPIPAVKSTRREVPIGDGNCTLDLLAQMKNGQLWAYEIIHHSISNVSSAAAKLQGKNFAQITFVCSDHNQREAVRASIKNAGFDPDFAATIRYQIFSTLLNQKKQLKLMEMQ